MKKLLALILIAVLMLSTAACSSTDDKEEVVGEDVNVSDTQNPAGEEGEVQDENADEDQPAENPKKDEVKNEETKNENTSDQGSTSATPAQTLAAAFKACAGGSSAQAIADKLIQNEVIPFAGGTMAVEPGFLTGFGNAEITGFSEGVMFAPGIGTIPFIGYIFVLEDGTDVGAFMSTLKSNADQRWNICTAAEETVVSNVGNKVFFVMSPKSFDN